MAIFFEINQLPVFQNAVVTIGTFDGVHLGHRTILNEVVKQAASVKGESVLVTFEPHPRKLLVPNEPIKLLTPLNQKLHLLAQAGIANIVVSPFTLEFSQLSATEYIEQFLVKYFHPHTIIIGHDHHFGHDRKGNIHLLKQLASKFNYKVVEIPARLIDDAAVSSTKIRRALQAGDVYDASLMLGRPYSILGTVIKGAQIGRTIGYPTANIQLTESDQLIPAIGIYAVHARLDGKLLDGMMSVGFNPTVTNEKKIHVEVNLFNFEKDIYNAEIEIQFITRLRDEEKFNSLDELKEQLHRDKSNAVKALTAFS